MATECNFVFLWISEQTEIFSYTAFTDWFLWARRHVFTARYELN